MTVEAQAADPGSMLSLYRSALGLRRSDPDLRTERFAWLRSDPAVLAFGRGDRFVAIANLGSTPVAAPSGGELLLSSHELVDGCLPGDATGWWRLGRTPGDER
jgi:alpha-glucosidase